MKLSRIALGGLLALGLFGLSADFAHAHPPGYWGGGYYAPRPVYVAPSYGFASPFYGPVYSPSVFVQPRYNYYPSFNSGFGFNNYPFGGYGYNRPGVSFGFSYGTFFR